MKPAPFDYARPQSVAEALTMLGEGDALIAGGQSLLPLLGLRMAQVRRLVDISRLSELRQCSETADAVVLGAGLRHADIEDGHMPDPSRGLLARMAGNIAYRSIRHQGTLGGSIAMADPAADWPVALMALQAIAIIAGPRGERRQLVEELIEDTYTTSLQAGEILTAFEIPKLSAQARSGVSKVTRKSGAFALSLCVAVRDDGRDTAMVVIGGAFSRARRLPKVAQALKDGAAGEALRSAITADLDGLGGLDAYEKRLHGATIRKAVEEALA